MIYQDSSVIDLALIVALAFGVLALAIVSAPYRAKWMNRNARH